MQIAIIGAGAIGSYVRAALAERGHSIAAIVRRPQSLSDSQTLEIASVDDMPASVACVVDCGGHEALRMHGASILAGGRDLVTLSIGALADAELHESLRDAASRGQARLHLASGAIGALDCLRAAAVGGLSEVTYTGRKPPRGWMGSPAENLLDLSNPGEAPTVHFDGTARDAAINYPKNANVAAAVALAGAGFDATRVKLIADPSIEENIHQVEARGAFGAFSFEIRGQSLPDNPKSSALAAMSAVSAIADGNDPVHF